MTFQTDFMEALFTQMDPNNLLCMAWKWQRGDVSRVSDGDLSLALSRIKAKTFVMPIDTDMFFTIKDCQREQEMIANSEFRPLTSLGGHLALFGFDKEYLTQVDNHLKDLLSFKI
jgi:homoserine O-acetyltransferase